MCNSRSTLGEPRQPNGGPIRPRNHRPDPARDKTRMASRPASLTAAVALAAARRFPVIRRIDTLVDDEYRGQAFLSRLIVSRGHPTAFSERTCGRVNSCKFLLDVARSPDYYRSSGRRPYAGEPRGGCGCPCAGSALPLTE